jgi:hypothetical protein
MKKVDGYRHGELLFVVIKKLPKDLEELKTKTITRGSHNNPHTFENGKFYDKNGNDDQFAIGYFESLDGNKLFHAEHGNKQVGKLKECSLPVGVYQVCVQHEDTNEGMKQIID